MRKYIFISIIGLVLIVVSTFFLLKSKYAPGIENVDPSAYENLFSSSSSMTNGTNGSVGSGNVDGIEGSNSSTNSSNGRVSFDIDKIKHISTMYGEGNYEVATSESFVISFMEPDQFFSITLLKSPVGWSRKLAEDKLIEILGLSKEEICKLNIFIGAPELIDSSGPYGYGLSFCPGSVVLPALDPSAQ
jgi:hypothetical protein